jgi:hypothetical protein
MGVVVVMLTLGYGRVALAEDEPPDVARAREEFLRGADYVKRTQWADALAAFERSAALRPHAVTTFNIGVCERAMGRYVLAREAFTKALVDSEAATPHAMSDSLTTESRAYVAEIERALATATISLNPPTAAITVDGRPLATHAGIEQPPVLLAGVLAPGRGTPPPAATFRVVLDPGVHVITLSRVGFSDAIVNRTFAPGEAATLALTLDRLPATLRITSDPLGAAVALAGVDSGQTPLVLSRPAGNYHVLVRRSGYSPYEADVSTRAGESVDLRARLTIEHVPLTRKWWFWTAIGAVVAGVAVGTYFIVREAVAQRPPLNGGGLGWTVPFQ